MIAPGEQNHSQGFESQGLEGRGLSCRRGERLVFAKLSFALAPGGLLLLRGPNGSGKSSLLRLMAGLLKPEEGALFWHGSPVGENPDNHRARLAFLGHLDAMKPALSAAENLSFWCGAGAAAPALAALNIAPLANRTVRLFSQGQRRRLALARILASRSLIWLLDEPTNALDDEAVTIFANLLAQHRKTGGMAVIALHGEANLPQAATLNLAEFAPLEFAK